jgi:energy-coupling factor transporter ATP-binding protein EcfA2
MSIIPDASLESHIGILGKTGSGKSNAAKVIAEVLMHKGERVCALDPTGTWWGLRLDVAGKKPSRFAPVIFGGDHGDIPISRQHGALLGEAIGTSADSAIIDVQQMRVGERVEFATEFAEALLRANRGPLHLIVDEAHLFAPQGKVNDPQSGKMVQAFNNLVSLGRGRGLRIILISQRPAKLHKDSLTQVETLIAMRLIAPQDRAAIRDWVGEWADKARGDEIIASLPSLPVGDAWVWAPQLDYLQRKHFPLASTYDSGTAQANAAARELPPIDTAKLGEKMNTIRQEAQANDPKRLKARIAELEREKAAAPKAENIEAELNLRYEQGARDGYAKGFTDGAGHQAMVLGQKVLDFAADFALATAQIPKGDMPVSAKPAKTRPPATPAPARVSPPIRTNSPLRVETSSTEIGAERKPLAVLVSAYPGGMTEAQWAQIGGFKRTGGTWGTYKSRLRSAGRIQQVGDLWYATEEGVAVLGENIEPMPAPGPELVEFWCSKIGAESKILRRLAEIYPEVVTKEELADHFEMVASGGTFGTYLSRLRSNGLIESTGTTLRASPTLMERA